jgi:magnesium chelatase subunit I
MSSDPAVENDLPTTLGALRASGWQSLPVRVEIARNVAARIAAHRPVVEGVLGFDDTINPQLEHALLAGHDVIFLGERGQAKSRIIRSLVELLDEQLPVIAGSEINDDPYHPISRYARDLVAQYGDDTEITWIGRADRYGEKLATPDTSIADLIGEVDPIKVAEGRYLSDELTIHYGLVPRTNRGIFAINELPDLAERIQVGLLNILEERDVQIRGHRVRLPVDVLLLASANPDDYTSRGRIITPLKDRFGAQIRTHYPLEVSTEVEIVAQEMAPIALAGVDELTPAFMSEIVARISQGARASQRINQRSGVSVRASIANQETLAAAAVARALRLGEATAVPRPGDLEAIYPSMIGKVEVETFEDDDDVEVIEGLIKSAVLATFHDLVAPERLGEVIGAFEDGLVVDAGSDVSAAAYVDLVKTVPGLDEIVTGIVGGTADSGEIASAAELVLEGLYLSRRLSKKGTGTAVSYRAR